MKASLLHFMNYFIGDTLASTSDVLEKRKTKMIFWFCVLISFFLIIYLPVLGSISTGTMLLGLLTVSVLTTNLFILKKYNQVDTVVKITFTLLMSFIQITLVLAAPANPTGYFLWSILLIASASFLLGKRWTIFLTLYTLAGISITSFFVSKGILVTDLLNIAPIEDISKINMFSIIKLGIPLIFIVIVLIEFVGINKSTNAQLTNSLKTKEDLIQKITEKESALSRILDSAADIIYEIDSNEEITFVNTAFEKALGYKYSELKQLNTHDLIPNPFRNKRLQFNYNQIKNKIGVTYDEFPILSKNQETIWIGQKTNMIFDDNGKFVKAICVARDITKNKEVKDNLKKAKQLAEDAAMAKARFLSAMSHEIRTPMNAIIGIVNLMDDQEFSEEQKEQIGSLKFSANNLLELIKNILDFNKLEENKIELQKKDFKLFEITKFVHLGLEKLAAEKGLELKINIDQKLPTNLIGDPLRVSQILNNLAHNAIKFTDNGAVTIDIIEQLQNEELVEIYFSVTDSGIGIPKDKLELIFEDFKLAHNETIRQGAGLGLSLSKKLVELHKGKIYVESEIGEGSKFSFLITFEKKAKTAPGTLVGNSNNYSLTGLAQSNNILANKKVLIVEDNIINQKVTSKILKKWDMNIDIAANGKIGIEKVQSKNYDFVLMDLQMPIMDGIEATKAIRMMGGKYAKLPIIALTASAVLEIKQNAIQAGLDDFITKPFKPDHLFEKLVHFSELRNV